MDTGGVVHVYNGIFLAIKKNAIMSFATTWIDLEIIIPSKVSEKEEDKCHMISLIYGI